MKQYWEKISRLLVFETILKIYIETIGIGDNIGKYIKNIGIGDNIGEIYRVYWDKRQYWEKISRVLG